MKLEYLKQFSIEIAKGYLDILTNGFSKTDLPVKPSHFIPYNEWIESYDWVVVDKTTGEEYLNEAPRQKRLKHLGVALASSCVHAIGMLLNLVNRIVKIVTFAHFWHDCDRKIGFEARFLAFGKDLLIVVFSPLLFVGLQLSPIYGLFRPNDGGKLYAAFERATYGRPLLAPCFQPNPKYHLGGAPLSEKGGW